MPELPKHFAFIVSLSNEEPFTKRNTNSMELGLGLNLASATVKPKEDKADDELKHHKFLRPWTWATRPDDRPAGITVAIFKSDKDWIRKDRIDLTSTPPTNVWPDSDDWFGENDFSDAWTKLLSAFEERANSLSHLWDLGKPDIEAELNDSAEHLRDFHANLSTSAHPIGVYANVTRHAVQRIEFVEGMDHYLVFAAPKIDAKLFGNDKELTPDFAKVEELDPDNEDNQVVRIPYVDADKKNGQIDGVPVFAYMVPLRLLKSLPPPKPTAPEMEPSLVNLRNYWVRQRMEDEDLPWYADDWSSKLEVHAPLGFDLAQHLVDWLRLQLDKGPTATEDLNLLGVRDAVLCTLCDTSHPGDRASLAKVSLVDLLAFEMFQDDDRQRFKVAISEAYKELELQQWVDTLKAGVPTVKSMECLDEKEVLSLTLERLIDQLDRLQGVLADERVLAQLVAHFWAQALASAADPPEKIPTQPAMAAAIRDRFDTRSYMLQSAIEPYWFNVFDETHEVNGDPKYTHFVRRYAAQLNNFVHDRFGEARPDKSPGRPIWPKIENGISNDHFADFSAFLTAYGLRYGSTRLDPRNQQRGADVDPAALPADLTRTDPQSITLQLDRVGAFQEDSFVDADSADYLRRVSGFGALLKVENDFVPSETGHQWQCLNMVKACRQGEPLFKQPVLVPLRQGYVNERREITASYDNQPLVISEEAGELSEYEGEVQSEQLGNDDKRTQLIEYRLWEGNADWSGLPELLYGRTYDVLPFVFGNSLVLPKGLAASHPADIKKVKNFDESDVWEHARRVQFLRYLRQIPVTNPGIAPSGEESQAIVPTSLDKLLPEIPTITQPLARELERVVLHAGFDEAGAAADGQVMYHGTINVLEMRADEQWRLTDTPSVVHPMSPKQALLNLQGVSFRALRGRNRKFSVDCFLDQKKTLELSVTHESDKLVIEYIAMGSKGEVSGEETVEIGYRNHYHLRFGIGDGFAVLQFDDIDVHDARPRALKIIELPIQLFLPDIEIETVSIEVHCRLDKRTIGGFAFQPPTRHDECAVIDSVAPDKAFVAHNDNPLLLLTPSDTNRWIANRSKFQFKVLSPSVDVNNWLRWWPTENGKPLGRKEAVKLKADVWSAMLKHRDSHEFDRRSPPPQIDDPAIERTLVAELIPVLTERMNVDQIELRKKISMSKRSLPQDGSGGDRLSQVQTEPLDVIIAQVSDEARLLIPPKGDETELTVNIRGGEIWELRIWAAVNVKWCDGAQRRFDPRLKRFGTSFVDDEGENYCLFSPLTITIEGAVDVFGERALLITDGAVALDTPESSELNAEKWIREIGFAVASRSIESFLTIESGKEKMDVQRFQTAAAACRGIIICSGVLAKLKTQQRLVDLLKSSPIPILIWEHDLKRLESLDLECSFSTEEITTTLSVASDFEVSHALGDETQLSTMDGPSVKHLTVADVQTGWALLATTSDGKQCPAFGIEQHTSGFRSRCSLLLSPDLSKEERVASEKSDPLQQLFKTLFIWSIGVPIAESLWHALEPQFKAGARSAMTQAADVGQQDRLEVTFHRKAGRALRYISDVDLLRQVWRWTGTPLAPFPFPSQYHEGLPNCARDLQDGLDHAASLRPGATPDPSINAMLWDAEGFSSRPSDDHMRVSSFVPLNESCKTLHAEQLVYENRARYDRYSAVAYSRYRGLLLQSSKQALRNVDTVRVGPSADVDRWRRILIPCRWQREVPRPAVNFLLPLTEGYSTLDATGGCTATKGTVSESPRLLAVLGENWFEHAGLAEELVASVELTPVPFEKQDDENDWKLFPEFGPDPIINEEGFVGSNQNPGAVICTVEGPVGSTFDTSTSEPLYVRSWFMIHLQAYLDGQLKRNIDWSFAKLQFHRRLNPEAYADADHAEAAGCWQCLTSRIRWPDDAKTHSIDFYGWTKEVLVAERPLLPLEVKRNSDGQLSAKLRKLSGRPGDLHSFGATLPWRIAESNRTYQLRFVFDRDERSNPKMEQTGAESDRSKVSWSLTVFIRADGARWHPVGRLNWHDEKRLKKPSILLGKFPEDASLEELIAVRQSKSTDAQWIQVLPNSRRLSSDQDISKFKFAPAYLELESGTTSLFTDRNVWNCLQVAGGSLDNKRPVGEVPRCAFIYWIALTELVVDAFGKPDRENFVGVFRPIIDTDIDDPTSNEIYLPMKIDGSGDVIEQPYHQSFSFVSRRLRARILTVQVRNDATWRKFHWSDLFKVNTQKPERSNDETMRIVSVSPPVDWQATL